MLGSNYDTTVRRTKYQAILKDARGWTTTGRSDGAADAQGGSNVRVRVRVSKCVARVNSLDIYLRTHLRTSSLRKTDFTSFSTS